MQPYFHRVLSLYYQMQSHRNKSRNKKRASIFLREISESLHSVRHFPSLGIPDTFFSFIRILVYFVLTEQVWVSTSMKTVSEF